ncbi:glycosyltransferase family 4 protein [Niastella caeni]|uniref:Glycosyltransferase family 4 protein n=1 Tax=Niastella caeni TaxID=2569763 RepID=A0A4S8HXL9_9BACT|nr:glycosyltransferase family 1 protein [Niastella caeni]THU40245.1 glycosyltransferase family 4 protein [Niastella caeni]
MIIGFDAKRAFQNKTGLGNYSRTLLTSLNEYFPQHQCLLFTPKRTPLLKTEGSPNLRVITPEWQPAKKFPSLWRSLWMTRDLKKYNIPLYHGLSNELPAGINKTGIRSVVTIHDLIFEMFPHQYDKGEVWVYKKKFRNACQQADAIIATSEHTKTDIINIYKVHPEKVHVCYQSCDVAYGQPLSPVMISQIKKQYHLPETYFLYVGSIIERKNLLTVCKALHALKNKCEIPLVVIGEGKQYKKKVQQWLAQHNLLHQVIFLSEMETSKNSPDYQTGRHFPAIYQGAKAFIYPSMYEGFGIPVLEALHSHIPVITTNSSSLPEVGGDAALYFEPNDVEGLCDALINAAYNDTIRQHCINKAQQQILQFTRQKFAASVLNVYHSLI